jgi:cullin 4
MCDAEEFLLMMDQLWKDHCRQMMMIRSIFLYLDRTFVLQSSGVVTLWEMGLMIFRRIILDVPEILTKVAEGILRKIERERRGELVDRGLLKSLVRMFTEMQIYQEAFEGVFLNSTTQFYKAQAFEYLQSYDVRSGIYRGSFI